MKQKGLIALLILALLFTLAGCGKDKKQTGGDGAEETPSQVQTENDAGAEATPDESSDDEAFSDEPELPVQSGTNPSGNSNSNSGSGNSNSGDNGSGGTGDSSGGEDGQEENSELPYDPNQPIELPPVPLN